MTVKTLYRYNNTVSLTQPEGNYTTLLRVIADDGYILKLPDGTLTNCIDCETSEGITEVTDTMGRQMELMGYDKQMQQLSAALEALQATSAEQDAALIELASMVTEE